MVVVVRGLREQPERPTKAETVGSVFQAASQTAQQLALEAAVVVFKVELTLAAVALVVVVLVQRTTPQPQQVARTLAAAAVVVDTLLEMAALVALAVPVL